MLPAGPQRVQHPVDVCFVFVSASASARRLSGRGEGEGRGGVGPPAGPASGRSNAGAVRRPGHFLFPQRRNWPRRRRDSPRRARAAAGGSERSGPRKAGTRAQGSGLEGGSAPPRGRTRPRVAAGRPPGGGVSGWSSPRNSSLRPEGSPAAMAMGQQTPGATAELLLAAASASLKFWKGMWCVGAWSAWSGAEGGGGAHCSNPFPNAMHPSKMELIIMTAMRDQTDLRKEEVSNHLPDYKALVGGPGRAGGHRSEVNDTSPASPAPSLPHSSSHQQNATFSFHLSFSISPYYRAVLPFLRIKYIK